MQNYSESMFLGMPLEWYSHILGTGVLIIWILAILHILGYVFFRGVRMRTHTIAYHTYLTLIGLLALLSTTFALIYQFGYLLTVCELCWWQRIFMFPIEFIVLASLVHKSRGNELAIGILSLFGIFFAWYHYWLHFQSWVMQVDVVQLGFMHCTQWGILPSCTEPAGVVVWGFLTIPFMALIIFLSIAWLSFLASRTQSLKS